MTIEKKLKIVVVKTDGIGDAILASPFFYELRKNFGNAYITGILSSSGKEVLDGLKIFDEIIVFNPAWLKYKKVSFLKRIFSAFSLLFLINKIKPDLLISLRWQDRITSFIFSLSSAKKKIGYDVKGMGFGIHLKAVCNKNLHTVENNMNLLKLIFPEKKFKIKLGFSITKQTLERVKKFLKDKKINKYIVIHPVSGHISKDWGIFNYLKLSKKLSKKHKVIIIGSKNDKNIEKISGSNIINTAGIFNIKETGALIKNSEMVIGGDSAAVHIASVFKKKTLTIFSGAALYENWAAYNKNNFILVKNVKCRGCELIQCNKNHECMDFGVEYVYKLVNRILYDKQKRRVIKIK